MIETTQNNPKRLSGTVISDKMNKTIVVRVNRFVKHPKYQKYYTSTKNYKVHDPKNICKIGDSVDIIATRPISKDKSFKVVYAEI